MNAVPESKRTGRWVVPFAMIWTGQAFSLIGSQLVQFALIWWLTKTTGSATVLATATLVGLLPPVLLGPIAGALIDRWNRRVAMIVADACVALFTLLLALAFLSGVVQVWHVYLLMFLRAAAGSFHAPAMQASTSLMVPKEHLSRVQGVNQMLNGGLNIIAAPLGALLLEVLPLYGVLAIDIGTALLAVIPLFIVAIPQPKRSVLQVAGDTKTTVWQDMLAGLRYIRSWPGMVLLLVIATLINLVVNPAFALLPLLVTEHFNGQALQYAWMEAALGTGIIAGGLVLGIWGGFRRRIFTSLAGLIGMGVGSLIIGLTPASAFSLAVGAIFLTGFANPITNGPLLAVLQATVAPEMQGRVFTLIGSATAAMTPVGLLVGGPVADAFGVQFWFVLAGITMAFMGAAAFFIPAIARLEDGRGEPGSSLDSAGSLTVSPGD